jgi:hypothetical protein
MAPVCPLGTLEWAPSGSQHGAASKLSRKLVAMFLGGPAWSAGVTAIASATSVRGRGNRRDQGPSTLRNMAVTTIPRTPTELVNVFVPQMSQSVACYGNQGVSVGPTVADINRFAFGVANAFININVSLDCSAFWVECPRLIFKSAQFRAGGLCPALC